MAKPPRSQALVDAQKAINEARILMGSPSTPPAEFDGSEDEETAIERFPKNEPGTSPVLGSISLHARMFKNDWARLLFLFAVIAAGTWLVASGAISFGVGK